jgi:hypothetical protein
MSIACNTKTSKTDDGKFERLAVVVAPGLYESVDIISPEGKLLMRLSLFNHETEASIDVIPSPKRVSNLQVAWWVDGVVT